MPGVFGNGHNIHYAKYRFAIQIVSARLLAVLQRLLGSKMPASVAVFLWPLPENFSG
jgi:hypothetical protein